MRSVLLDRPVSGRFGSVQRTSRRNRSLKDDEVVLNAFEAAGIERERPTTVDPDEVDEALDVTERSESDVEENEKETRLRTPRRTRRAHIRTDRVQKRQVVPRVGYWWLITAFVRTVAEMRN